MNSNFRTEIISPKEIIFSSEVKEVVIPGIEGEMTILFEHIPLITFLRPGFILINNNEENFFVEDGVVEFFENNLTILSSKIKRFKEVTKDYISLVREKTLNQLKEENLNDKEKYILNHKIEVLSNLNI